MRLLLEWLRRPSRSPRTCRPKSFVPLVEALGDRTLPTPPWWWTPAPEVSGNMDDLIRTLNQPIDQKERARQKLPEVDGLRDPRRHVVPPAKPTPSPTPLTHHHPHHLHHVAPAVSPGSADPVAPFVLAPTPSVSGGGGGIFSYNENAPGGPPGRLG